MAEKAEMKPLGADDLDALFEAARTRTAEPTAALFERVLADAEAEMPTAPPVASPVAPAPRRGLAARLLSAVGGWPAATGLVAAAATGVFIGMAAPSAVETLSGGYVSGTTGYGMEDLMVSYAGLMGSGG
ncbi:hypothetical protein [Psychromarinibacter sp. S121]|uniref:hypothetical protein n=1 Tax=Psychromarinibacter sp. S121 TaxID=3415127 RepID=UPI003C79E7A6